MTWFIPGNVPSSKNSQTWTGKFLVKSKTCQKYEKETWTIWSQYAKEFRKAIKDEIKPLYVQFKFIRGTRHKFDYINAAQFVQDLMVKYDWIDDDNADELVPVFKEYIYNKANPGVFIKLIKWESVDD